MRLFLDTSVLLAAAGSTNGALHAVFSYAALRDWILISSPYVLAEVHRNISKLPASAASEWLQLQAKLSVVEDVLSLDWPAVFFAGKDRPILFAALASADVLLTLDRADFADVLGGTFYGLRIHSPSEFLLVERAAGRL